MRPRFTSPFLAALLLLPAPVQAEESAEALAEAAVKASQDVAAINVSIRALQQRIAGAGAWMDPVLALSYMNMPVDRWAPGASPMSGIQLSVKQSFLWPGKTAAREEQARAAVDVQRQDLAERKVQLRAMVRRAYLQLALVRQLHKVTARHITLLEQLIRTVRVKYEVGKVGQHQLLRLQVRRDRLTDELGNFRRDDEALTASLNAALRRDVKAPIETPARLVMPPPPPDMEALIKLAATHRPALRRHTAQAAANLAMASRATREGYPDISAWFAYTIRTPAGNDPGTNFVTLGLAVPLPVFSDTKWDSMAEEARLRARQAELTRGAALDRLRGELGRAVASWSRAREQAITYRDKLTPGAQETLDATAAAYQVDRADFASLFEAELQLLTVEQTTRRAEATAHLARVEVEAMVGREVKGQGQGEMR